MKRSTAVKTLIFEGALAALTILSFFFGWFPRVLSLSVFLLILVPVNVAVLRYDAISSFIAKHKKVALLAVTVLGLVFAVAFWGFCAEICLAVAGWVPKWIIWLYSYASSVFDCSELLSYYTAQLSLTFISISVMSVLSDKSVTIYWSNVSKDRLISPTFTCFAAYTYYSIAATVGAGIGVLLGRSLLFALCFIANIIILILLTASVIDVYYGRDTKRRKLVEELEATYAQYPKTNNISEEKMCGKEKKQVEDYADKMVGLSQNIYKAVAENDFVFLQEVYTLYGEKHYLFSKEEGRYPIEAMVYSLSDQTFSFFAAQFDDISVSFFENTDVTIDEVLKKEEDIKHIGNTADNALWEEISKSEYLLKKFSETPRSNKEVYDFYRYMGWFKRRIAAEYNYYAALYISHHPEVDPGDYFIKLQNNKSCTACLWSTDKPIDYETFEKVLMYACDADEFNGELMVSMARIFSVVFKDSLFKENYIEMQKDLPYVYFMLDNLDFYQIDDHVLYVLKGVFDSTHPKNATV